MLFGQVFCDECGETTLKLGRKAYYKQDGPYFQIWFTCTACGTSGCIEIHEMNNGIRIM